LDADELTRYIEDKVVALVDAKRLEHPIAAGERARRGWSPRSAHRRLRDAR
jgi:hypothetical protein